MGSGRGGYARAKKKLRIDKRIAEMKAHRSPETPSHVRTASRAKLSAAVACLVFTAAATTLLAAEQPKLSPVVTPKLPPGVTCEVIRAKVAEHGMYVAYAWAKQNGYSDKHIAQANQCLRS
jgi:hypothetical protein